MSLCLFFLAVSPFSLSTSTLTLNCAIFLSPLFLSHTQTHSSHTVFYVNTFEHSLYHCGLLVSTRHGPHGKSPARKMPVFGIHSPKKLGCFTLQNHSPKPLYVLATGLPCTQKTNMYQIRSNACITLHVCMCVRMCVLDGVSSLHDCFVISFDCSLFSSPASLSTSPTAASSGLATTRRVSERDDANPDRAEHLDKERSPPQCASSREQRSCQLWHFRAPIAAEEAKEAQIHPSHYF